MKILNTIQKLYHVLKLQSGNMVRFLCEKRSEMIRAIKFGATFDQVSAKNGCQKRTVKNTWQRYLSTGSVRDVINFNNPCEKRNHCPEIQPSLRTC